MSGYHGCNKAENIATIKVMILNPSQGNTFVIEYERNQAIIHSKSRWKRGN